MTRTELRKAIGPKRGAQQALARRAGVSQSQISAYLRGYGRIGPRSMGKIKRAIGAKP